jgi:hypothetical protein
MKIKTLLLTVILVVLAGFAATLAQSTSNRYRAAKRVYAGQAGALQGCAGGIGDGGLPLPFVLRDLSIPGTPKPSPWLRLEREAG